jgi:hypothetical protein
MEKFVGKDNFVWWVGVVEDRNDPLQLGRCRVRCYGWHTADKVSVATKDLPWAHPVQPITSAAVSGVGQSPVGPVEGTWVVGFFRDGCEAQHPVIIGTLGGIPQEPNTSNVGFNDPNSEKGTRPNGPYPLPTYLGESSKDDDGNVIYPHAESDTNRLARGATTGTITVSKITGASAHAGHPVANEVVGEWDEKYPPFNAQYPYNHVLESESGHTIEIDDTPDNERMHLYHRTGSFQEYHPDGSKVDKVVKDHQGFVIGNEQIHITGDTDILVGSMTDGGNESRFTLLVRGNADIQVDKNSNIVTKGNATVHTHKNLTMKTDGNYEHQVGGTTVINSVGNMTLQAPRIDLNPGGGGATDGDATVEITI